MTTCPGCGAEVSESAKSCPECGRRLKVELDDIKKMRVGPPDMFTRREDETVRRETEAEEKGKREAWVANQIAQRKVEEAARELASKKRDTYKYEFKVGNKIVCRGITDDLRRSEAEHQQRWPDGHIVQVGGKATREGALKWERTVSGKKSWLSRNKVGVIFIAIWLAFVASFIGVNYVTRSKPSPPAEEGLGIIMEHTSWIGPFIGMVFLAAGIVLLFVVVITGRRESRSGTLFKKSIARQLGEWLLAIAILPGMLLVTGGFLAYSSPTYERVAIDPEGPTIVKDWEYLWPRAGQHETIDLDKAAPIEVKLWGQRGAMGPTYNGRVTVISSDGERITIFEVDSSSRSEVTAAEELGRSLRDVTGLPLEVVDER